MAFIAAYNMTYLFTQRTYFLPSRWLSMLNSSQQKRPEVFGLFMAEHLFRCPNWDEPCPADPSLNAIDALPFVTTSYF